jgi:dUTP pyrophosphatase
MSQNNSNKSISIPLKKLKKDTLIPSPSRSGDAGADARIIGFKKIIHENNKKELIDVDLDTYTLKSLERIGCPLGFSTAIPEGYYFKVVPRSGLALWDGLSIVNSPGTIDAGYRNEWMVIVVNLSNREVVLKKGDRICQIILSKMYDYKFVETNELPESERGKGGFGSTGKS